jgi:hypothetical protein
MIALNKKNSSAWEVLSLAQRELLDSLATLNLMERQRRWSIQQTHVFFSIGLAQSSVSTRLQTV